MQASILITILGAVFLVCGLHMMTAPNQSTLLLLRFPRNKAAGFILTGICLVWSAVLLFNMPMGMLSKYKPMLYVLTPLSYFLIVSYMNELLAVRAFGGLLLLVPSPYLDAVFLHPSDLRIVIASVAYLFVIIGLILVVSPYRFRRFVEYALNKDIKVRIAGGLFLLMAITLIGLGQIIFK